MQDDQEVKSVKPTVADVANWMKSEVDKGEWFYQETAVRDIEDKFGEEFVYTNANGSPAIATKVLAAFRKITPNAIWEKRDRAWRLREDSDPPGRLGRE